MPGAPGLKTFSGPLPPPGPSKGRPGGRLVRARCEGVVWLNRLVVDAAAPGGTIHKNIYGHFAEHLGRCVYEGLWVGEDSPIPNRGGIRTDVVDALRRLRPGVLRWPGGCFADEYHWRDGIGPRSERSPMVNTHWGQVVESNHFGTHEFFDLCELLGADPYICGNVGSGSVREMQDWVEYATFAGPSPLADLRRRNGRQDPWRLPFFGVGNENWGCGGHMRAEYYADLYRRYQTYVRRLSGNRLEKIACGPNGADYRWTEVLMREAGPLLDGLSLHYYTHPAPRPASRSATDFGESEWFSVLRNTLFMDELLSKHGAIMDRYDPQCRVSLVVDEWGTWYDVEPGTSPPFLYQQNTLRDALVAGINLNLFQNHCRRVRMANIAQTVNVLQAMVLTAGAEIVLTPSYHVFEMYQVHQNATLLPVELAAGRYPFGAEAIPLLSASASRDAEGAVHVSLCNTHPSAETALACEFRGWSPERVTGRLLTAGAMNAHNTFGRSAVEPVDWHGARVTAGSVALTLPAKSVLVLELR